MDAVSCPLPARREETRGKYAARFPGRRSIPTSLSTSLVAGASSVFPSAVHNHGPASQSAPTCIHNGKSERDAKCQSPREFVVLCRDLQAACEEGNEEKLEEILSKGVNPNDEILRGKTPLYWAVVRGRLAIVKLLVERYGCDPLYVTDHGGTTLFHAACSRGHVDVVRYLSAVHQLDTTAKRKDGSTPMMAACFYGHLAVVIYLAEELRCDTRLPVSCSAEGSLLHVVCSNNQLDVARYLVAEHKLDPNARRGYGDTPMHVASRHGHLEVVMYLSEELSCSLEVQDDDGDTPLHVSAQNDKQNVVKYLLQKGCKTDVVNSRGQTPLMVACRYRKLATVKLLLELGNANPNCHNLDSQSALQCTCDKAIIKELVRHGANTTNFLSTVLENHPKNLPLEALVRMFVIGHPMAGKSTLVQALQEITGGVHVFRKKKVTGVVSQTAGIVPIEFDSPDMGRVLLFDFAGHNEFYASHAVLLEASKTAAPLFILVVNLLETEEEIKFQINFWLSFINSHHVPGASIAHIAVIGSHKDKLRKEFSSIYAEKLATIAGIVQNGVREYMSLRMVGFFAVDCRKPHKHTKLRTKLRDSCKELRSNAEVDGCCHVLSAFLSKKFEGEITCTVKKVTDEIRESDIALPCTSERICVLIEALSERQNILFLRNQTYLEQSWIVLEVDALLTKINGCIFAPANFKEHRLHSSTSGTGVLSWSHLQRTFLHLNLDPELVVAFLRRLEFCEEVVDADILRLIQHGTTARERCRSPTYFRSMDLRSVECNGIIAPSRSATTPGRYCQSVNNRKHPTRSSAAALYDEQDQGLTFASLNFTFSPPVSPASMCDSSSTCTMTSNKTPDGLTSHLQLTQSHSPTTAVRRESDGSPLSGCLLQPPLTYNARTRSNPDIEHRSSLGTSRLTQSCNQLGAEREMRFFFFPGLLSHERPNDGKVWSRDNSFEFHTCWCMKVSHVNQFFTPRLLQILLLRISFGFAVAKKKRAAGEGYKSTRQCTVWKNGIRWLDLDGIETVVEMVERNRAMVVLMRGKMGSELKCVGLRSKLIHLVLEVKNKFCPNLKVDQYLLDPKGLVRQPYPFATRSLDTFTLYEMSTVVTSIVELKDWVFDTKGDSLCHLNDLLYFEPYTHLGVELLGRICADENEEVTDEKLYDFLHEYSQAHYTRGLELSEILKVCKPPLSPFTVTTPVSAFSFSCSSCSLNASGSHSVFSTSGGCTPQSHTDQLRKGVYM